MISAAGLAGLLMVKAALLIFIIFPRLYCC
jgi:hypothetical protein